MRYCLVHFIADCSVRSCSAHYGIRCSYQVSRLAVVIDYSISMLIAVDRYMFIDDMAIWLWSQEVSMLRNAVYYPYGVNAYPYLPRVFSIYSYVAHAMEVIVVYSWGMLLEIYFISIVNSSFNSNHWLNIPFIIRY